MKRIKQVLSKLWIIFFALLFTQAPSFFDHYTNTLGSHLSELTIQVEALEEIAKESGKDLNTYIEKFLTLEDTDFSKLGEFMRNLVDKKERYQIAFLALVDSPIYLKPMTFTKQSFKEIYRESFATFQYSLSFTLAAVVYAILGALFGYLILDLIKRFILFLARSIKGLFKRES